MHVLEPQRRRKGGGWREESVGYRVSHNTVAMTRERKEEATPGVVWLFLTTGVSALTHTGSCEIATARAHGNRETNS